MADQALFNITVAGQDISETINPILENLTVTDKVGAVSDTASITLDDSGGGIIMPRSGDPITIALGWKSSGVGIVFDGTVDTVRSSGAAGGGRTLQISGMGMDAKGKAKEPLEFHKDDASLEDFMQEAAGKAGMTFRVAGALGSIKRPYWSAGTESFIHLGQRIAREVNGNFKIAGKVGIISAKNSGMSVSGQALSGVTAAIGVNLLTWDISPVFLRPRFQTTRARFYDREKAKWMEETVDVAVQGIASQATHTHRQTRGDKDEAKNAAEDNKGSSERERGGGTVTILGNPRAQPEATCTVSGTRPGIDGSYKIDAVTHTLSSAGFTTKLELVHPEGDVGSDKRSAGTSASKPAPGSYGEAGVPTGSSGVA